jgi:hypothetical protein
MGLSPLGGGPPPIDEPHIEQFIVQCNMNIALRLPKLPQGRPDFISFFG